MKIVVMLPTYNEAGNIQALVREILALGIQGLEVMVVDDNSPDGTSAKVKALKNPKVHLLLRTKNKGRGTAGREGFIECLKHKPDLIVEMDADFSHNPRYIPQMIEQSKSADIVLGSRYMRQSREERGQLSRAPISNFGKGYVNLILGLHLTDPLSGFRCFRREVLESISLQTLRSRDYFIVAEVIYRCKKRGFKMKEIPIVFERRREGVSKLSPGMLLRYITNTLRLRFS